MAGDIRQPTLSSNAPVTYRHSYECILDDSVPPVEVGESILFIDTPDGIDTYKGALPVGQVDSGQVQRMREQQRLAQNPGRSVRGIIVHVSQLTNTFRVEVVN